MNMKKLILVLSIFWMCSCTQFHYEKECLIIIRIENDEFNRDNINYPYKVTTSGIFENVFYTTQKYNLGDTISFK